MKIVKSVANFLLVFLLTMVVIVNFAIYTCSNTILNKNYIMALLEEKDYYRTIQTETQNKFDEYKYQSGLPEEIFDNLYTYDLIKSDINSIIAKIYENKEITNSSETIKNNLENNINKYLADNHIQLNSVEQKNIDEFENLVVQSYEDNMAISENTIKEGYTIKVKIESKEKVIKTISLIAGLALIIILLILNIRELWNFVNCIMIVLFSAGILLEMAIKVIENNVDIGNIVFITNLLTNFIKEILYDLIANVQVYSIAFMIIGILGIIISNYKRVENKD